ncbi:MAG: radical SAM protein [Candidatus Zixiibacteriota bacterium]
MKFTLCVTQACNLACDYCYIVKQPKSMSAETARKAVDFIYDHSSPNEVTRIGFFGGEPLLQFDRIKQLTEFIETHPDFASNSIELSIATNGTIINQEIIDFAKTHDISVGISCDGPPIVHDLHRVDLKGMPSSIVIAENIDTCAQELSAFIVNAVHRPDTIEALPEAVDYFVEKGVKNIYLNPDYSATWDIADLRNVVKAYKEVGDLYISYYLEQRPVFISLIDYKITTILRKGYRPEETCRMGRGEFAITADGFIYPCERLIGTGDGADHCIGHLDTGIDASKMSCHTKQNRVLNSECLTCSLKDYCMNWCGCSNFMASGYYNRVNDLICVSEKAALGAAFEAFRVIEEKLGPTFCDHFFDSINDSSCIHE